MLYIFLSISFAIIMMAIFASLFQKREVIISNVDGVYDPVYYEEVEYEDDYNVVFFTLKELRDNEGNLVVTGQEWVELEECYYNAPHALDWQHYAVKFSITK